MNVRTRVGAALIGTALLMSLTACGSGVPSDTSSANDMQVVAGDEDQVEADGTIELTSPEIATCKDFVNGSIKVHDNMQAWADSGSSGAGWQSYTAGLIGWFQDLALEIKTSTTPEFVDALQTIAGGGADALKTLDTGVAPTDDDYDREKIITGLDAAASICESAGIAIVWY
jgi:hypothetical protein